MFTEMNEAMDWLNQLDKFSIRPGLERMDYLLGRLGHPERRLKFIHISGTNGKGSTSAMLEAVLRKAGYCTGLFTSPYIESFNSRIRINGEPISSAHLLQMINEIRPLVEEMGNLNIGIPTEFEMITVLAILYFATVAYPDIVIWETGLGGRLDSTNVVYPLVSVITNVGLDHMNILGGSLADIAREKAGIIKNGVPVVTGIKNEDILKLVTEVAEQKKAKLYATEQDFTLIRKIPEQGRFLERMDFQSYYGGYKNLEVSLLGKHQAENASIALMTLQVLKSFYALYIEEEHIREGLKSTLWPGRFERISTNPTIILDGAHNEDGIRAVVETLHDFYPGNKVDLLFAVLKDKPYEEMVKHLTPFCREVRVTAVSHPRGASPAEVAKEFLQAEPGLHVDVVEDWKDAFRQSCQKVGGEGILLVAGSLYFISDIRKEWFEKYRKAGE